MGIKRDRPIHQTHLVSYSSYAPTRSRDHHAGLPNRDESSFASKSPTPLHPSMLGEVDQKIRDGISGVLHSKGKSTAVSFEGARNYPGTDIEAVAG